MKRARNFWRNFGIVLRATWINLVLFCGLIVGSAFLLRISGCYPEATWLDLAVDAFHMAITERVAEAGDGIIPAVLTFLIPLLTVFILGEGILRILAVSIARKEHRKEWDEMVAKSFKKHIVICGVGELGQAIVKHLYSRNPSESIVLVDKRQSFASEVGINSSNISYLESDMTTLETLDKANCRKASMVILCSGSDTDNLEAAYKVDQINPKAQIWVRLYSNQLTTLLDVEKKPNIHFFSPYQSAAEDLVSHLSK
jgi:voltage-gated potassium channel